MQENYKKRHIKLILLAVFFLILIAIIAGYTYSYFATTTSNNTSITGTVESNNITVTVTKEAPSTDNGLTPQLDSAITQAVVGANGNNCVNAKSNEICEVHKIVVTNIGSSTAYFDGIIELINNENPNLKWALIDNYTTGMTDKPELISNVHTSEDTFLTLNEKYESNETKTYYLVLWISETGNPQNDTGSFTGTVTFRNAYEVDTALETLTLLNLTDSIQTDTPNFDNTSCSEGCDEATVGIYSMEDDLGTSYYFRGDVTNNYVKFGNVYWRIIRINGDGTVRMIYDGTTKYANGVSSTTRHVIEKEFYLPEIAFDNAYLGYMYGEIDLSETDENVYSRRFTNTNDSTIKDYLDNTWYPSFYNNLSQEYKNLIADAIYCNDRSSEIVTGSGDTLQKFYAAYQRLDETTTPEPILTCTNENDRFTLNNSSLAVNTNKKLNVPVGMITADELILAGASKNSTNNSFYLYTGNYYWTITPYDFFGSGPARIFTLGDDGKLGSNYVPGAFWVRPVISLKADALKYSATSNGSMEHPFTVTG